MNMKKLSALILAVVMLLGVLAGCKESVDTTPTTTVNQGNTPTTTITGDTEYVWTDDGKNYTYNTWTTVSPSNWNELTYQDSNDSDLISYVNSSFFTYDFKFDEYGEIVPGEFTIKYMAAIGLEDVTAEYAEAWGLPGERGYAFKITLRDDLKWDNGDPIVAADFVYTMKEQLNPLFQHYRADSYYAGSVNLVGAEAYAKQGRYAYGYMISANYGDDEYVTEFTKGENGAYSVNGKDVWINLNKGGNWGSYGLAAYWNAYGEGAFVGMTDAWNALAAAADADGYVAITDEHLLTIQNMIAVLHGYADVEAYAAAAGDYAYLEWQEFCYYGESWAEVSWDTVGLLATDTYELVVIMTNPIELIDDEGNLTYHCAYDFSGLPLVHKETYEACKQEPVEGSTLWTTTYNSSLETTRSWGAFKLESFQAGKEYVVVRNTNWFGYHLEENEGLYLTDRIVVETLPEWNTAWLKFQAGEIEGISMDVSIASEYKGSSRAFFTPSDFIQSAQLQSDKSALEARQEAGINKTILTYTDFRKAMSLAIDRNDYAFKCTTSSLAGFGIFNSMHYYDVANGGVYRNTDEAKQVLCDTYAVDVSKFASLDDAVASITGYNLEEARKLVEAAYQQALTDGSISATDKVVLTFGTSADTESSRRHYDYLSNAWTEMCKGTSLEGRIEFEFNASFGDAWANDFRSGAYDICLGGWSGAAWNPGYFLLAYLDPEYMYSTAWDTSSHMMTFTMQGVGENGEDITDTMSLIDWYNCLNGLSGCKYDFSEAALKEEQRLQLIAALEAQILQMYYTVPMLNSFSASLLSYKVDYITYEYNTFMGYGGLKYMTYNYTDEEWADEVAAQNGQIDYKK